VIVVVEESNDQNHKGREVELIGEGKGGETDDDMDGVFPSTSGGSLSRRGRCTCFRGEVKFLA